MARIENINRYNSQSSSQVDTNPPGISATAVPPAPIDKSAPVSTPAKMANRFVGDSKDKPIEYNNAQQLHDAVVPRVRSEQIQGMSEDQAMKQGNISPKEYWTEQLKKDPTNAYSIIANQMASDETPQEKAKREKSERLGQIFSNLGNVIGNAANLYYTTKGAPYIDLNSSTQYENQRMQQIKDKRDALQRRKEDILLNARTGEISYDRNLQAARQQLAAKQAEKAADRAYDATKFGMQMDYNRSRDDASNNLKEQQLAESRRHNAADEGIGRSNAATSRMRANIENAALQAKLQSNSDKNNDYLPLGDNLVPIPKAQSKALYAKLYQTMKRDPQIQGDDIENLKLQFGEGGDQDTKMMNIVRRRLNDSPAAVEILQNYLGVPSVSRTQSFTPDVSAPWIKSSTSKAPWVK